MAEQIFKNPTGKGDIKLNECKLSKSIPDYKSRAERIPELDKNYVDFGIQYKLAQIIKSKEDTFKNEIPIHIALKGHMGTGKDSRYRAISCKIKLSILSDSFIR